VSQVFTGRRCTALAFYRSKEERNREQRRIKEKRTFTLRNQYIDCSNEIELHRSNFEEDDAEDRESGSGMDIVKYLDAVGHGVV
jgi:hypothetical protein